MIDHVTQLPSDRINNVTLKLGDKIDHVTLKLNDMINHVTQLQSDFAIIVQVTQKLGDMIDHVTLKLSAMINHVTLKVERDDQSCHSESRVTWLIMWSITSLTGSVTLCRVSCDCRLVYEYGGLLPSSTTIWFFQITKMFRNG